MLNAHLACCTVQAKAIESFADLLTNFFGPLLEATRQPDKHPALAALIAQVGEPSGSRHPHPPLHLMHYCLGIASISPFLRTYVVLCTMSHPSPHPRPPSLIAQIECIDTVDNEAQDDE